MRGPANGRKFITARVSIVLIAALALAGFASGATIYYDNTGFDSGNDIPYVGNGYSGIGDAVGLSTGPVSDATDAYVMFANNGSGSGTFDASLSFYQSGSPVGLQIGNSVTVDGVSITPFDVSIAGDTGETLVDFALPSGLTLPQNFVWIASVSNATDGLDLAVEQAEGIAVGSNTADTDVTLTGSSFTAGSTPTGTGNPMFALTNGPLSTPEPSTWLMAGASLAGLAIRKGRTGQRNLIKRVSESSADLSRLRVM